MSIRRARAIAYGVVALLAVGAVYFTSPIPPRSNRPAGEVLSPTRVVHTFRERYDTVGHGESIVGVLARGGVSEVLAREALKVAKTLDPRRIPAGMQVLFRTPVQDTLPSEVVLQLAVDRLLLLRRDSTGWSAEEQRLPWKTDTVVVDAVIKSNLYESMDVSARDVFPQDARQQLIWTLADVFEYRADMSRDLRVGDSFRVLAERNIAPNGAIRMRRVIAATMTLSGVTTEAVRFASAKVGGDFFDANGRSLRAGFLRAPLQFRRISSNFGMRVHPILGTMRKHQGTDYAANAGTPVRAVGDGTVTRAGWSNGYGNLLEIRHTNGFITRYGHMKGFAQDVYAGARVKIEQTVGYVGSTGLSTAPHLHFEVLVHGVQSDPRTALANQSSEPIPAKERLAFTSTRTQLIALLQSPTLLASAESAKVRQAGSQQQ